MKLLTALTMLLATSPAWGQYTGPAVLTRGEAPAAITFPQIRFRPYAQVSGVYDNGLAGVSVRNSQGELADSSSEGVQLVFGVSGAHSWKHTKLGMSYQGGINHYTKVSYYDGLNQSVSLSLSHEFSRHAIFTLNQSGGIFSRDFGLRGLQQTVAFDPTTAEIPVTDFFDNRTIFTNTQASFVLQKSARLSFSLGGDSALIYRRSKALYSSHEYVARGDAQYRVSKRTTLGGFYSYSKMGYSHVFGSTDGHTFAGSYSVRLSRSVEFSAYAGLLRVESTFQQTTALDPVIAALLGVTQSVQIFHNIRLGPTVNARVSKALRNGVVYASGGRSINAGNGLFLTTEITSISAGYSYTGLRRWSASVQGAYARGDAFGNVSGVYGSTSGGAVLARTLGGMLHLSLSYQARQYNSPTYSNYNRLMHQASIGLAISPGEMPLRVW